MDIRRIQVLKSPAYYRLRAQGFSFGEPQGYPHDDRLAFPYRDESGKAQVAYLTQHEVALTAAPFDFAQWLEDSLTQETT